MKKLGLIGGTGPQSTMPYYLGIVYGVQKKIGELFFPNLTIESVDVYRILDMVGKKEYANLVDYFLEAINNLVAAGADFVALSANTSHIVFDDLQAKSPVPIVSIIEVTVNEAKRRGFKRIGLLGTKFTMTEDFYRKPFRREGIEIVVPFDDEKEIVDGKIMTELENGIVKKDTLKEFQSIISRMKNDSDIEGVILGCTELPLLLNDSLSPVPCLDTVQIHIASLIKEIINH